MATTIGKLSFLVAADSSGVAVGLKPGESAIQRLQSITTGMVGQLSALFGGLTIAGAAGWGVKLAADAEDAQIAFGVMLQSGEKAKSMLAELRAVSEAKPLLNLQSLRDGAQLMLGFGVAAEAVIPSLEMIGDISGGNQQRMESLTLAFAQSAAAGRLMGQDLLQMINAGFNPLQEISKRTGESMADLRKRMEAGAISSKEVVQAFQDATSAGGRFFGMLESKGETLSGKFAQLKTETGLLFMELGNRLLPTLKALTETGITVVDWLNNLNPATVKTTVSILAMGTAFGATIALVPRIVAAGRTIVATLKAIATGGAIAQALSGPQGLASLALGLAAAAGAGIAVNQMFDGVGQAAEGATTKTKKVKEALDGVKPVQWGKQEIKVGLKDGGGDLKKQLGAAKADVSSLFNAGDSNKLADNTDLIRLRLEVVNDQLKQARDTFTELQAKADAGLGTRGLDEARRKFGELSASAESLHSQLGESLATTLKTQLDSVKAMQESTKKSFEGLRKEIESKRDRFTAAAERFSVSGQEAIASARQEGLIQKELQKLRQAEMDALRRIEEREIEVRRAIEEMRPIRVVERKI